MRRIDRQTPWDVYRSNLAWDFDPSKLSSEQLEGLAHQWILQATGNDAALAEQTRRELEAKVRMIEGKAESGNEPGAIVIDAEATPVETRSA